MKNSSISKVTIWLMLLTMVGRATGLLREMMLSYIYGASSMSDAYVVAATFSSVFFAGIASAILNGYIPIAVEENEKGNLSPYTRNMMIVTALMTYLFAFVLMIGLKPALSVMARGFSGNAYQYAYQLSYYVLAFSPILCIINILVGYLQVKGVFWVSAAQSVITNIIMIVIFYITVDRVEALGIGYGFSVIIPLLIIFFTAHKKGYRIYDKAEWKNNNVYRTWRLVIPTLGVQLAAQLNSVIDRSFASTLEEGTVSSLKYAFLICSLVVSIIAVSIGMVQYPKLALAFNEKNENYGIDIFVLTLNSVLIIIVPIVFGTVFFAELIIKILFERGAFTVEDTQRTSMLLQIYAFAILGNSLQEIISRILLATKRARALFILYTGYVLLNIMLNLCFIKIWGAKGLAFGTTLSTLISVLVMLIYLTYIYKHFHLYKLAVPFIKTIIASVCMIAILTVIQIRAKGILVGSIGSLLYLAICVCIGAVIYFVGLLVQKEKLAQELWNKIKCRLGGQTRGN